MVSEQRVIAELDDLQKATRVHLPEVHEAGNVAAREVDSAAREARDLFTGALFEELGQAYRKRLVELHELLSHTAANVDKTIDGLGEVRRRYVAGEEFIQEQLDRLWREYQRGRS